MNITISSVRESLEANMVNALDNIEVSTSDDQDHIASLIMDEAQANDWDSVEVIYYHEAWEIVSGSQFNDYEETVDLEGCTSALDAVMREAQATMSNCCQSLASEIAQELAGSIVEVAEAAEGLGHDGELSITSGSRFGWAVHDRENAEGVCYYTNLENEKGLTAVEHCINGSFYYASACFNVGTIEDMIAEFTNL